MSDDRVFGSKPSEHQWTDPPPGQGRLQVCSLCGDRDTPINRQRGCTGRPQAGDQGGAHHDYDPYL